MHVHPSASFRSQAPARDTSFRTLLLDHLPRLRAVARGLCRNADDADDLVQQTVLKALTHLDTFRPGSDARAWLITILKNQFRTDYRVARRWIEFNPDRHSPKTAPAQSARLEYHALLEALDRLPPTQREALILVTMSGLSYAEAAQICGCEIGTIKSRVNRARSSLAGMMDLDPAGLGPDGIAMAALCSEHRPNAR
jgi:RNA polymerase sigma-70 factor, ECF subfamily